MLNEWEVRLYSIIPSIYAIMVVLHMQTRFMKTNDLGFLVVMVIGPKTMTTRLCMEDLED